MPPRSTLRTAGSKAAFVNFSTPVPIGTVPLDSSANITIAVPKSFKPGKPTFVILSGPLEAGLNVSASVSVTGNTPTYSAVVQVSNSTAAAVVSAVTINTLYQE